MIRNKSLRTFLAFNRIAALGSRFKEESAKNFEPAIGTPVVCIAILISLLPPIGVLVQNPFGNFDLATVFTGIAMVLAMLMRSFYKLPFRSTARWWSAMSLTHTAFGLGAIPLIFIILLHPEALQVVGEQVMSDAQPVVQPTRMDILKFMLFVAVWAGLTEEFVYRAFLLAFLRRWTLLAKSPKRDLIAVLLSALIFSASHIPAWGFGMSFALLGLGAGFGVAYIAISEAILPLVVYHAFFDLLSLGFSYFSYKF